MAIAIGDFLRFSTERGTPIVVGDRAITPIARIFTFGGKVPGLPMGVGFTLVHPARVEVREGSATSSIPIPDVTRGAGIVIAMLALLANLLWSKGRKDMTSSKEKRP